MLNLWLILRDDAKVLINDALKEGRDYSGDIPEETLSIFRRMLDRTVVQKLFKAANIGGDTYHLYSIYFKNTQAAKAAEAIAYLVDLYPNRIIVGGAWRNNGDIIAGYEPHPQLIRIMPDIIEYDETGAEVSTSPATELVDINLLLGQSPRKFT
jgi:hypothetical protein